jgi:hypothetical protein
LARLEREAHHRRRRRKEKPVTDVRKALADRTLWLLLAIAAPLASAQAQAAPLTVPGGALRVTLGTGMASWDDVLPGPGEPVELDAAQTTRLDASLGLALGISGRLTLFGSMPFERYRVQAEAADGAVDIPGDRRAGPGDATAGIAWRVAGTPAAAPVDGTRLETAVLARFPTGRILRSGQYYTLASGDGQTDIEVAGRLHLPGGAVGIRVDGSYVLPFGTTHTGAELDPHFVVAATPWLRLSRRVALEAGVQQLVRDDADGGSATAVGGGLAFYAPGGAHDGRTLPIAASWRVMKVVSAADGAPEPISVSAGLQLYYGLFR